ncbi:hypothetical protein M514_02145 [Trichuris suis]|uniref:Retrotransposon gag domain-containing protein n=1 Tax=Trichuris suis TaxID=68888 RepID=A0A085MI42_9BILA|nr:hypothetical protein M513_02145 [Trichuris suis]KFD66124.1 hypothetical protein M514_02145 [Trichuris suis]
MKIYVTTTSYRGIREALGTTKLFDLKLIPEFDARGEWLEKLELVCELSGVADTAQVIPLRLTGGAFAVYQQMTPEDRKQSKKIKETLLAAFAVDRFVAYRQLTTRKLRSDESIDVFLAGLRRLSSLAGGASESLLGCVFVAGLPEHVQGALWADVRMEDLNLCQLLARAKAVLAN